MGHSHMVTLTFNAINTNAVVRNSAVSVGEVAAGGWASHDKANGGNGNFFGLSIVRGINNIWDNDIVDAPLKDMQENPTGQNQKM